MLKFAVFCAALLVGLETAQAGPLEGTKSIILVEGDGSRHSVGTVEFSSSDDKAAYAITWAEKPFTDHFLSMRPFKCVEGAQKYWCQVPYPYEIKREVSPDDLTDLEYDTMFIWKGATEYGINMWNGVYYQLRIDGDRLVGQINEIDMDTLSAPPEAGNLRPVRQQDLHPGEPDSHWLPTIVIE